MLSWREYRKYRKKRSTIFGIGKSLIWWLHRMKKKNHFSVQVKGGPDRDTMTPIKEPCRVGTISTSGIIFLGKDWPTLKAHATGPPCGPVSGSPSSRPDRCRVPVLLSRPDLPWPARCSRDTAMVAVFRLASPHPRPETDLRSYPNGLPALSRAGGAKRAVGRGRSGPNEHRFRVRR
jgi:hypothetical protein